jgi:transposase
LLSSSPIHPWLLSPGIRGDRNVRRTVFGGIIARAGPERGETLGLRSLRPDLLKNGRCVSWNLVPNSAVPLESYSVLKPIDRTRRDSPLYPGSSKTLADFIERKHLLRRIDATFDFASLAEFLHAKYDPWIGRPAIHSEVVIRAFILMAVYNVPSERHRCGRIRENFAWRWFCHLTLEDPVFDHSTRSVFRERLGADGSPELLTRLNAELERWDLLSPRTYVDSSPVEANVRLANLESSTLTPTEFAQRAQKDAGTYLRRAKQPAAPDGDGLARIDAPLVGRLPVSPKSLTGDAADGTGAFRQTVRRQRPVVPGRGPPRYPSLALDRARLSDPRVPLRPPGWLQAMQLNGELR